MHKASTPYIGWLTVTEGIAAGCRFAVLPGIQNVGSGPDNHVVITDPGVSKCHFGIKVDQTGQIFADYGSESGTYENDQKTHMGQLDDGDRFTVGDGCGLKYTCARPAPVPSPWKLVYGKVFGFLARSHPLTLGDNWIGAAADVDLELGGEPWAGALRVYPDRVVLLYGEGFLETRPVAKGESFELGGKSVSLAGG